MKRTLLLFLLSVSTLWGQFLPDIPDRLNYAAQLNGTSQYFSKATPPRMDLNGSEILTVTTTFDADVTGWEVNSGSALAHETTIKRTGAGSARTIRTGANSIIAFRPSAAVNNATTIKVTGEVWVYRTAGSTGSALIQANILNESNGALISGTNTVATVDTWVKLVVNGQLPGTQTGIKLGIQAQSAQTGDTVYVDDVSLTQAYDGVIAGWVKTTNTTNLATIAQLGVVSSGYGLRLTNTGAVTALFFDAVVAQSNNSTTVINDGRYYFVAITYNRTGNQQIYISGLADGAGASITAIGKISGETSFTLGARGAPDRYFPGLLGEWVLVRYASLPSDIASWIAYARTQRFIPEPPGGGTTILRLFGKENSAYDQSGNQGVLTNAGNTPIIPR